MSVSSSMGEALRIVLSHKDKGLGKLMFEMETQHGLPVEITIDNLSEFSREEIISGFMEYQTLLMEHKFISGMPFMGKRHEHEQDINISKLTELIRTGSLV